jgi:hypothetical protein
MMLRTLSDRTTALPLGQWILTVGKAESGLTFILANVLESESKSGIFALYYSYLAKSAFADYS